MNLTLKYKKDPKTRLPTLQDPSGVITKAELQRWDTELRGKYEGIVRDGDGGTMTFDAWAQALPLPAKFLVRVLDDADKRCPDLLLKYLPPEETAMPTAAPRPQPSWHNGFLAEVRKLNSEEVGKELGPAYRVGMRFAVEEIESVALDQPAVLAPLLFAGYLAVAERMCRSHDPRRAGLYLLAEVVLDEMFGSLLPEKALNPTSQPARTDNGDSQSPIKLRWTTRFLGWLLDLGPPRP